MVAQQLRPLSINLLVYRAPPELKVWASKNYKGSLFFFNGNKQLNQTVPFYAIADRERLWFQLNEIHTSNCDHLLDRE